LGGIKMTDTSYLYQYFLEKSPEVKKIKNPIERSKTVKTKNNPGKSKEDKEYE
jgi:hypothetical protein